MYILCGIVWYHCILFSVDLEQWKCWIYCWLSSSILAWKASLLNSRLLTWLQMDWRELTVFSFLCSMNPLIHLTCPSKLFTHCLKLRTNIFLIICHMHLLWKASDSLRFYVVSQSHAVSQVVFLTLKFSHSKLHILLPMARKTLYYFILCKRKGTSLQKRAVRELRLMFDTTAYFDTEQITSILMVWFHIDFY